MNECKDCNVVCEDYRCDSCQKIFKNKIYLRNKERTLKRKKDNYHKDIEQTRVNNREYYKNNKTIINKAVSKYKKKKRLEDPLFKIKENMRGVVGRGFRDKGYLKESKTYDILGCDFDTLKKHIESQFEDWMSWDNYGVPIGDVITPLTYWEIDHIIPLAKAVNKDDVIRLNHYTNLQPLCSYNNRFIKKDN